MYIWSVYISVYMEFARHPCFYAALYLSPSTLQHKDGFFFFVCVSPGPGLVILYHNKSNAGNLGLETILSKT